MAEETWVMIVGVAVVVDKNEGGVLIKLEVCDRKRRGKCEKQYRMERERRGRRRWMEANSMWSPANAGIRTMDVGTL
jgi:hypothetical protein